MPASMARGVQAVGRFDSATLGLDRFDFDPDPNLPTVSVTPTFILDSSRLGSRFRDGESIPYFYDLTSSPGNAQYTRLPAGGGANPQPILVRERPHAGGLPVISFDYIQYYQYDVTSMTAAASQYHAQGTSSQIASGYTFVAGDKIVYDVYWPSTDGTYNNSGAPYMALDFFGNSPSEQWNSLSVFDQNGLHVTSGDLSPYATDKWYQRHIAVPATWIGDLFLGIDVRCEADTGGSFRARFRDVHVLHADGTKTWIAKGASWRSSGFFARSGASSAGSFPATTPDDQSGWYAMTADLASQLIRPVVYFVVAYGYPNVGGGRNAIDGQDARNAVYWSSAGAKWAMYAGSAEVFASTSESDPMGDATIIAAQFNGVSSNMWRNGTQEITNGSPGTQNLDRLRVGTYQEGEGGGQWSDWIGEILIYDGTLTVSEIHTIGAYLRDKWSLTWDTPVPSVVSVGSIDAQTTNSTMSLDASTEDNDITIVAFWTNASNTFNTPSGFTPIPGAAAESDANMSYKFFYRRMLASDSKTINIGTAGGTALGTTNGLFGRYWNIRNCKRTGDPFEAVSATTPATGTTPSTGAIAGLSGSGRLGLSIVLVDDDPTWSSGMPPATWTNAGPRSSSTTGGDGMADAISKTVNESGATDEASVNFGVMSLSVYWARLTLALLPI